MEEFWNAAHLAQEKPLLARPFIRASTTRCKADIAAAATAAPKIKYKQALSVVEKSCIWGHKRNPGKFVFIKSRIDQHRHLLFIFTLKRSISDQAILGDLKMTKNVSWYLDLFRLVAAFAVLIGHAQGYILPAIPAFIASHAEEAVSGFFVLSGFVIMFVLSEKEKDWRSYANARFLRLYSVAPIALLCTYLADTLGYGINPLRYEQIPFYDPNHLDNLFAALSFTNEFWFPHVVFGSNEAYWSLSFEVAYYVAIGLFVFLPARVAALAVLIWLIIAGPKIAIALPLWVLGVLTYKLCKSNRLTMSRTSSLLAFVGSIAVYMFVKLGFTDYKHALFHLDDLRLSLLSAAYYLGISFAFALNIFSFSRLDRAFDVRPPGFVPVIRWLAGGSFTLYLVHQPLLTFVAAAFPGVTSSTSLGVVCLLGVVGFCYLVAELGERRKKLYERAASYLSTRRLSLKSR